jgi:hypothetical protein
MIPRLRHLCFVAIVLQLSLQFARADAVPPDVSYAADLQAANADRHYSHIIDETQRVYIYRLHKSSALFRQCDKKYTGVLECSVKEMSEIEAQQTTAPLKATAPTVPASKKQAASDAAPKTAAAPTNKLPTPNSSQVVPFLRHDLPDISLFSSMKAAKDATGAQISYSSDRVAANNAWSIYGVTGVAYKFYGNYSTTPDPYILAAYVVPYVSINRLFNSSQAQASKNSDTIVPGLMFEVGVDNLWGGEQYFRFGGSSVIDEIANTSTASAKFEWIPVYGSLIHYPGTIGGLVAYRFDPELIVQYDSVANTKTPLLFSGGSQALRIGPQGSLYLRLLGNSVPIISSLVGNITYHWAEETYSRRSLSWFQSALTYNIDPNGYVGLTGSYRKGSDENTGKWTDIYLVSLSGKY